MSKLYEKISSLCAQRGIKPGRMCSDLGISRGNISDLKMGRIENLSVDKLSKISAYFDVSIDYLLGKESTPPLDETSGWYPPLRFWSKINNDREHFMHYFLQEWKYPIEDIRESWGILADAPNVAPDDRFRQFIIDTVKAVRIDAETGEWDIVIYLKEKMPTTSGEHRRKLHSVARLESADITPEMDRNIADYIDYLIKKREEEK